MHYICSGEEMQAIDSYSIHTLGIPGIVLMEKAAMAMEEEVTSRFPSTASVFILAECGNNGGDGLALGRMLAAKGYFVTICEIGGVKRPTASYLTQKNILDNLGIATTNTLPKRGYDIYVDAVFGVGLSREISGIHERMIREVNDREGCKIAVDVPSGVNAANGQILGVAFKADLTITFGLNKIGLVLYPGAGYAGEVVVKDIGFPREAVEHVSPSTVGYGREDLALLPRRHSWSNKGSYGRVLLIAGSKNMAGAAFLSARAAYAGGCGLVRIFTCEENREILQTLVPEAIMTTFSGEEEALALLPQALSWADVTGIGPGLGVTDASRRILIKVLEEGRTPLVIDADGINVLAELLFEKKDAVLYQNYPEKMILTPHLKEMERLTGRGIPEIKKDLIHTAALSADPDHIYVLKDAKTIVSDGGKPSYINRSGNHGMAVGGSGDVLTGMICAFLAQGMPALEAARLGVYCHGLAGDEAAREKGYYGMRAQDIVEFLGRVIC